MILKGKKVILRPLRNSDGPYFVQWLKDPDVNKFTTRRPISIRGWGKKMIKQNEFIKNFAIDTKDKNLIGSISLYNINKHDKNATISILIGDKNYWGKGYGTDAMITLVDYAFSKLKLHKMNLEEGVYEYNKRAISLYRKLGFKNEGVIRENVLYKGKFYNTVNMGILRSEWVKK
jgi:RimJ/RimL family protein N-acetyltransferase